MSAPEGSVVYACPMHPDVVAAIEGICPQCGIKLFAVAPTYACPTHPEVVCESPDRCFRCGMKLEVTNPGVWMAHCHIAEHHESGMVFTFNVAAGATPHPF
jgi:hypothetical protein